MPQYCILEIDDGWTIVEHGDSETAAEAAHRHGGVVIDPGPFDNYADASDALEALQMELNDEDDSSDLPGTQALEGRYETDD